MLILEGLLIEHLFCILKHPCDSLTHHLTIKAYYWSLPAVCHYNIAAQILAELDWVVTSLWKMCDAKSATITSILTHLQKKEREESKRSVQAPSILRTFVCLCSSRSSWEDSRTRFEHTWKHFSWLSKKRELPFEISICIWKGKNGSFELVPAWVPDHFIYISASFLISFQAQALSEPQAHSNVKSHET